jgi:hypothetical protein
MAVGLGRRLGQTLVTTLASKGLLGAPRLMDVVEGSAPAQPIADAIGEPLVVSTRACTSSLQISTCYLASKMKR